MGKEEDLIRMISSMLPRSPHQLNRLFEGDAEILELGGTKMLFTMDEFSPEDMLLERDPFTLGWNLAVGTMSDILAAGGRPLFYAHSMTAGEQWDEAYIQSFARGVASALTQSRTGFIGGDFGQSKVWRYTGAAIGVLDGKPLLRSGASPGEGIFISGRIGAGNLAAFLTLYEEKKGAGRLAKLMKTPFSLRLREAELVKKYATACIDTSDGVCNGLGMLAEMSGTGYAVRDLPYLKTGALAARLFSLPKTLLFLGECGEYELLFTLRPEEEGGFFREAAEQGLKFYRIGRITEKGQRVLEEDGRTIDLSRFHIRGRDFADTGAYIKMLRDFIR